MMSKRIIITKPGNFMMSMFLINLLVLVVGIAGTMLYVSLSSEFIPRKIHNVNVQELEEKIATLESNIVSINESHELEKQEFKDELMAREYIITELETNITKMDELADDIMSKYYYVFKTMDDYGTKDRLSFSHMVFLDEQCKEKNIDPHVVLGLYNLESRFNTSAQNANSTARGVGQFLRSTGQYIYDKYLDYDKPYDHYSMAIDPYINIEMTVSYLAHLSDIYNGNMEQVLIAYNGGELGNDYYERIDKYMVSRGVRRGDGKYR